VVVEAIVREGEKLKPVRVDISARAEEPTALRVSPVATRPIAPSSAPPAERRPIPWYAYATAGLGVVAAGGFAAFAIAGASGKSDLEQCRPDCSASDISDVRARFITADVFLGVSLVALGATAILYLTRPTTVDERR
jgi:hypothetical protein